MTAAAFPTSAPAIASPGWKRLVEWMLLGGATVVLLPMCWVLRRAMGLESAGYAFGFSTFYAAYLINDPHFAVTYLLFYRRAGEKVRAQPVRWTLAGIVAPVVLVVWSAFAIARRDAQAIGWMVQLMYLLVGWHYAKQGFGALMVLSARRGVVFTTSERRVILANALLGWAFAWANPSYAAADYEEKGVIYSALAHPRSLELATGAAFAVSTIALIAVLARKWRNDARAFPWGPVAIFFVTLWAWTIFSTFDPLLRYVIPALHSIQYGWFVWLMRRNEARADEREAPEFSRSRVGVRLAMLFASAVGLAWLLFHGAPGVLDAALVRVDRHGQAYDALGATPYLALFFVFVNVHHFVMDAVIWRRENPETRFLRTA